MKRAGDMRFFFFFQAEDGIRDKLVTGVQTCALPIYARFLACQVEPRDGVEEDEEKRDGMERDEERRPQAGEESRVRVRALRERPELPECDTGEERHEDTGQLAQHEAGVGAVLQPPPDRDAATIPPRMVRSVAGLGSHRAPRGRRSDLSQWMAPVSLYCWMAPAGSTCLGHTFVHSPTKVHCQMPSCSERISSRSGAPSSRESML